MDFGSRASQRGLSKVPDFRAGGMEFVRFVRQNEKREFNVGGRWQHQPDFRDTGKGFADFIRMNYLPRAAVW